MVIFWGGNYAHYTGGGVYSWRPPIAAIIQATTSLGATSGSEIIIQAELVFGDKAKEGLLVQGVSVPWKVIVRELSRDPNFLNQLAPRKLEELVAAAYEEEGWDEVILTPPSGDKGRDVIASKHGFGRIRIYEQIKRYSAGHLVEADDVRALLGVLEIDANVSKGIVTTTSDFAPGIWEEFKRFIPYRLDTKNGEQLKNWLLSLGAQDDLLPPGADHGGGGQA